MSSRLAALATAVAAALGLASCGGSGNADDAPPGTLVGNERLAWDQPADSAGQLSAFQFLIYVDSQRQPLADVACGPTAGPDGFACTAPLPAMTSGVHTLEMATALASSGIESPRSAPLVVTVRGASISTGGLVGSADASPGEAGLASAAPATQTVTLAGGGALRADVIARGLDGVGAIAVAPDGALFLGDRLGRIGVLRPDGTLGVGLVVPDAVTTADGGGVLDVALDPGFAETRLLYVLDVVDGREGPAFRLARYREVNGVLGERAVLTEGTPAPPEPVGSVAVGPDGRLFVAFGSAIGAAPPGGAYGGRLLRLNPDGTTPAGPGVTTPVIAGPFASPRTLTWDDARQSWWLADAGLRRIDQLRLHPRSGFVRTSGEVPGLDRPAALTLWPDAGLLVADGSSARMAIVRASRDERSASFELAGVSRVRTVEAAPDGTVYLATDGELLRLLVR
jgi:glucose/arabinose dehydrogenase